MTEEPVSMETVGPISVDYYVGMRVESVKVNANPHKGEPVWTIIFEGGAKIYNYDAEIPAPRAIVGAGFTMQILGVRDTSPVQGQPRTVLRFGMEQVLLNPMEYAMQDEVHTKGKVVFPQHSNVSLAARAARDRPEDQSEERIEQGPDGGPPEPEYVDDGPAEEPPAPPNPPEPEPEPVEDEA